MNHSEFHSGLRVSYWRNSKEGGSVAADKGNAAHACVEPLGMGGFPNFVFALPSEKPDLEKLLMLAAHCVKHGDWEARKEIRAVLGVQERR